MKVDLHLHSRCSDGTEAPSRLAQIGSELNLVLISLTDHDTVDGVPRFLKEADRLGIRALTGIEMSTAWEGTLHLLGYGFQLNDPIFQTKMNQLRCSREERNQKMLSKIQAYGFQITEEDVRKYTTGQVVGRPHFAKAMIAKGYVTSIREAFKRYLGKDCPCYVPKTSFEPEQCIDLIRQAKGKVSFAHPLQTADLKDLPPIVANLKDMGLWGMECFSGRYDLTTSRALIEMARYFGLVITAGSDFHGENRPSTTMGSYIPDEVFHWEDFGFSQLLRERKNWL